MDFSDRELKVLLQALYRYRGDVSGATQSEQNRAGTVGSIIAKIEGEVGPAKADRTSFDREMDESLAVLKTGRAGAAKARSKAAAEQEPAKAGLGAKTAALDKAAPAPKVSKAGGAEPKPKGWPAKSAADKASKATGGGKAGSSKNKAK